MPSLFRSARAFVVPACPVPACLVPACIALACLALTCIGHPAAAQTTAASGSVLDRVHKDGIVHCGGTLRPGLAIPDREGNWHGLEPDMCRAIAVAALGPDAKMEFHSYAAMTRTFDAVRAGQDDVSFLTASEILAEHALPAVLPGPPVFYLTQSLLVLADTKAQHADDLKGRHVCAEPGTGPERSLNAWFAARNIPINFFMFQEAEEMQDAFYSGRCDAISNDTVNLAAIRLQADADDHEARFLPETMSAVPLLATTPQADGAWATIVTWTIDTLLRGETIGTAGPGGGADPLPLDGKALGLAPGWQAAVLKAVGNYGEIYDRDLGDKSQLEIPRGLNALWTEGGLMCPPYSQ